MAPRPILAELAARRRARRLNESEIPTMPEHVFQLRLAEMARNLSGEGRPEPLAEKPLSDDERWRRLSAFEPERQARIFQVVLAAKRQRGDVARAEGLERALARFAWWRDRPAAQPALEQHGA
jgi:hypothetical protein